MRISDRRIVMLFGLAALGACSRPDASRALRVACATGDAPLTPDCTVETAATPAGLSLTLRRADGGFRRLLATHDARSVVAADGAQPALVTVVGRDAIEVRVGEDRYRLPATVAKGAR